MDETHIPADNPIGNVFDKFMGKGKPRNVSEHLTNLTSEGGIFNSVSHILQSKDKYDVLRRVNSFTFYDKSNVKDLGKELLSNYNLGLRLSTGDKVFDAPENLGGIFSRISEKHGLSFAYNKSAQELYMVSPSGRQVALPLQKIGDTLESGLVRIGQTTRGAYTGTLLGAGLERTYSDFFYNKLAKLANDTYSLTDFMDKASKISTNTVLGQGVRGPVKLQSLLGSAADIRGSEVTGISAKLFGARSRVIFRKNDPLLQKFKNFQEARSVINQITKTGFMVQSVDSIPNYHGLSAGEALRKAWSAYDQFSTDLAGIHSKLGVSGYSHMIKPDFLIGEKDFTTISEVGKRMFTARSLTGENERILSRGLFQRFHESVYSSSQLKNIAKLGESVVPSFVEASDFDARGIRNLLTRRSAMMAVYETPTAADEMRLFGDSGSFLTDLGSKSLKRKMYLGGGTLKNPTEYTLQSLATLLGRSSIGHGTYTSGALTISPEELRIAKQVSVGPQPSRDWIPNYALSEKERALRKLYRSLGKRRGELDALAAQGIPFRIGVKYSSGGARVNFWTARNVETDTAEMVLSSARTTASKPVKGHPLYSKIQELGKRGISIVTPSALMGKMDKQELYISNFLSVMSETSKLKDAMHSIGANVRNIGLSKLGNTEITLIGSREDAYKAAVAYTSRMAASKDKKLQRLADSIVHGRSIGKGIRMRPVAFSIRADEMGDLDIGKPVRMTLGKMKSLAWSSAMAGYSDPNSDPIFAAFAKRWQGKLRFSGSGMDFGFPKGSNIREFIEALSTPGFTPDSSKVLSFSGDSTFVGGKKLRNIPILDAFRHADGGVHPDLLQNTILGKEFKNDVLYLDLGKKTKLSGLLDNAQRYLPVPMMFARLGLTSGGMTVGKSHPFHSYMKLIEAAQEGKLGKSGELISKAVSTTVNNMVGKEGLVAKMNMIHMPTSFRARPIPNVYKGFSSKDMFDSSQVYDLYMSRNELQTALLKKSGYSKEKIIALQKAAKHRKQMYVMMGADPTQRGSHIGDVFRLNIVDTVSKKPNVLGVQAHPLALKMLERDIDRDAVFVNMIESLLDENVEGVSRQAFLQKRISMQEARISPLMRYMKGVLSQASAGNKTASILADEMTQLYMGQKTLSSLGYTISRPNERFMNLLVSEGYEGLERAGVRLTGTSKETIQGIQALFANDPRKLGAAMALNQYMFQAGVAKAGEKGSIRDLTISLQDLADDTRRSGTLDVRAVLNRSEKIFQQFISSFDKSPRFWETTRFLLEGLQEGAKEVSNDVLAKSASRLMAQNLGLSVAIRGLTKSNIRNVTAITEDNAPITTSKALAKRLINPIMGVLDAPGRSDSGLADEIVSVPDRAQTTMADSVSAISSRLQNFARSKYFVPSLVGVAAAAAYGLANQPSLPPPTDVTLPTDRGPTIPNYSNIARIHGSTHVPNYNNPSNSLDFSSISSNYFDASRTSRITIEDKTSPSNPWLLRQQMQQVAESDFTY